MELGDMFLGVLPVSPRQEQKDQTHARILAVAIAMVSEGGEEALTMRAVAHLVGVAERTVHRHFKTRDELLLAVWQRMLDLVGAHPLPQTADALVQRPRRLFPRLSNHLKLVRAYLYSRARREGRLRSDTQQQQTKIACVEAELVFLNNQSLRRRAAIIEVITSPYAWELMHASWGFSGNEAGEAAAEAVEILLNRRPAD
jgi:AcrR family transcriptional regulator